MADRQNPRQVASQQGIKRRLMLTSAAVTLCLSLDLLASPATTTATSATDREKQESMWYINVVQGSL